MANVIILCDGTWNTPDNKDGKEETPTNVVKIQDYIDHTDKTGAPQTPIYQKGVGTSGGPIKRLMGGAFGKGLENDIQRAYKELCDVYRKDDNIYLFGFSRGSYTARSLAGLISTCGLLDNKTADIDERQKWQLVHQAFRKYKKRRGRIRHLDNAKMHAERKIHFIGVWDTVGALGIPDDMGLFNLLDLPFRYSFHDTELGYNVKHARHALAIDERRQAFTPTLWTSHGANTSLKQVWFSGVHADVGGGYADTGLGDITLNWMLEEAGNAGLSLNTSAFAQLNGDPMGKLHDSVTGIYKALKIRPRSVPNLRETMPKDVVHQTARSRHANPPAPHPVYWPTASVPGNTTLSREIHADKRWNPTGIFLNADVEYFFTASGEWRDASIRSGPDGTRDGKFQLGEIAHVAGNVIGGAESIFRKITGNKQAQFPLSRREDKFPWFSLVGVIANGTGAKKDQSPTPHETFLIGSSAKFAPKQDGYLYCFANDAWKMYWNNSGSMYLKISRGN